MGSLPLQGTEDRVSHSLGSPPLAQLEQGESFACGKEKGPNTTKGRLSNLGDEKSVYDWLWKEPPGKPLGAFSECPGAA